MQLPEIKERENRFKLALRMGLPIFALFSVFIIHTFITTPEHLDTNFYIQSIIILLISIYFIFYLIYKGFDEKIIDDVSKVFTRDALYKHLNANLKSKKEYSFLLISIDNLNDINSRYGIKNADKVIYEIKNWICEYLENKDIKNFPIGHINSSDFIISLDGTNSEYRSILEILCLKGDEFTIDDIEIKISAAINTTMLSRDLDYLMENLFKQQERNRNTKLIQNIPNAMNPSELENSVVNAIESKIFSTLTQDVIGENGLIIKECFVKLKAEDGKIIHPRAYMKVLDKLRLMLDFDLMVLEKNIQNCIGKQNEMVAVNISPTSIRNPLFIKKVRELFSENEEVKNKVIFLLYEKEYYSHLSKYNQSLQNLRELGIKIAIDRLGSSHTSFLYLRDLDIDIVRFDSIYSKDTSNAKYKNIIDGLLIIAQKSACKTWMKMIESEEKLNEAKKLGVDYMQGVYLSKLKINN